MQRKVNPTLPLAPPNHLQLYETTTTKYYVNGKEQCINELHSN